MAYTTINKSTDHFNTKLYTGNGATNAITGVGFQPDWIWAKNRDSSTHHFLVDVLRGTEYELRSNSTNHNAGDGNLMDSFDSDGFTLSSSASMNANTDDYVSWNWKAGGAGSANTDGSTSSTVSANQTAGFSIVRYTNPSSGAPFTVGHGLGVAPKMIITKKLNAAQTWGIYHVGPGFGKYLRLDSTADEASANLVTATSTTTFSTYKDHHDTGDDIIAYCFAEIKGFSRIGIYRGTSNADGPFVFCGFKPAFVLFKEYTGPGSSNWVIQDSKRVGYNPNNNRLFPNDQAAENTSSFRIDMLSNGFKLRSSDSDANRSGNNFLYIAFAEEPLVANNNTPCTAR